MAKDLKEVAIVEQPPRMEGRLMFMILAPTPKVAQKARELVRQAAVAAKRTPPPGEKPAGEKPAGKQAPAEAAAAGEKQGEAQPDAKPADTQSATP